MHGMVCRYISINFLVLWFIIQKYYLSREKMISLCHPTTDNIAKSADSKPEPDLQNVKLCSRVISTWIWKLFFKTLKPACVISYQFPVFLELSFESSCILTWCKKYVNTRSPFLISLGKSLTGGVFTYIWQCSVPQLNIVCMHVVLLHREESCKMAAPCAYRDVVIDYCDTFRQCPCLLFVWLWTVSPNNNGL